MTRFLVLGTTGLLVLGSLGACSSDENAAAPGATPTTDSGASNDAASSTGGTGGGGAANGGGGTGAKGGGGAGGNVGGGGASTGGAGTLRDAAPDGRGPEQTGQTCQTAADCFPNIADAAALSGAVECLDKVQDGYCTHRCEQDSDCCAIPGECRTDLRQVCSPFENTGYKVCFLSCEDGDIRLPGDAGLTLPDGAPAFASPNDFCHQEAGPGLACRSTGGGSANRKVCLPSGTPPGDGGNPPPQDGGPGTDSGPATDSAVPVTDSSAPLDANTNG